MSQSLNPDFSRRADEVIVPNRPPEELFGWTQRDVTENEAVYRERVGQEALQKDVPLMMRFGAAQSPLPEVQKKWDDFQKSKGRGPNSCDWSLLDEFLLNGQQLSWLPQLIGSCVVSNTFRGWVQRLSYQIAFLGMPQEHLGRNEFGPKNYSFYAPWTYGAARKRGNMRGGDGLYCEVMVASLLKDGVLPCTSPALQTLLTQLGSNSDRDFPETQKTSLYRAFGDWKYIEDLRPHADFALEDCPYVTTADQLIERLKSCNPVFCCSMLAIRKVGTHPDGFAIHGRDPGNSWPHNMEFVGYFYASDGELFFVFSNESWGSKVIYNVPYKEAVDWYNRRNLTTASIGNIKGPASAPPVIA